MFTINYKGHYINGYIDRHDCRVVFENGQLFGTFKTILGAKRAISEALRQRKVCFGY